jgi:hypothetical protein
VWSTGPSGALPSSFTSKQASEFSSENAITDIVPYAITDIVPYALIGTKEHHQGKQSPRLGEAGQEAKVLPIY